MADRLISPGEFAKKSSLSVSTLANMRREGIGPKPRKISARRWAYSEAEVNEYLDLKVDDFSAVAV